MSNGDDFGEKLVICIYLRFSTKIIKLLLKNTKMMGIFLEDLSIYPI
jgi:hypothetical protein